MDMTEQEIKLVEKLLIDTCPESLEIESVETIPGQSVHNAPKFLTIVYFKQKITGKRGAYEVNSMKLLRRARQIERYS